MICRSGQQTEQPGDAHQYDDLEHDGGVSDGCHFGAGAFELRDAGSLAS